MSDNKDFAVREPKTSSVRADLLGQLLGAAYQLEASIADLRASGSHGPVLAENEQRLAVLQALRKTLASAPPAMLAQLRLEIAAASAGAASAAQQAQGGAQSASTALAALNGEAHQLADRTQRALFDHKVFDASLRFGSAEEEEAYRRREAERLAMLDGLNPTDPRHERNRLLIQRDQLRDAMAHGADRDPAAHDMHREIENMLRRQRQAAIAAGADPQAFDAADEELRKRFPKGGQRFEEKGWYLGRGARGEAALTASQAPAVAHRTDASPKGDKRAVVAAADQEEAATSLTTLDLGDAKPAIAQLKTAGVSAAQEVEATVPVAPVQTAHAPVSGRHSLT